jgi:hypothetical protein
MGVESTLSSPDLSVPGTHNDLDGIRCLVHHQGGFLEHLRTIGVDFFPVEGLSLDTVDLDIRLDFGQGRFAEWNQVDVHASVDRLAATRCAQAQEQDGVRRKTLHLQTPPEHTGQFFRPQAN